MRYFLDGLLILISPIHQAGVVDAMLHPECMAQLMVHHLYHELHIHLILSLLTLLPLEAIAFFNDLLEGNQASSIFYRSKAEAPLLRERLYGIVAIVNQQICQDGDGVCVFGEMLCEVSVHLGRIIVLLAVLGHSLIKLGQICILEMEGLNLGSMEEGFGLFFNLFEDFFGNTAMKCSNINNFFFQIYVVSPHRSEQPKSLSIFLVFEQVVSGLWSFDGLELIHNGLQRLFQSPLLSCQ